MVVHERISEATYQRLARRDPNGQWEVHGWAISKLGVSIRTRGR